jgi:hypothetical protein
MSSACTTDNADTDVAAIALRPGAAYDGNGAPGAARKGGLQPWDWIWRHCCR